MDNFIEKIQKQLQIMSEKEKDAWIISQAKISPEWRQEDFYKSICGMKKVIDMPERQEIDDFCEKVCNGEIAVEYETHYVEFDDYGHFHDDWEHEFHDPAHAMTFLSSVIRGCHDLIVLEEYAQAYELLDKVFGLEFAIEDHPNTDDTCEDEILDLYRAVREGILYIDTDKLLKDYIIACRNVEKDTEIAAKKLVSVLEMDIFRDCKLCACINISPKDPLLKLIKKTLAENLAGAEKEFSKKFSKDKYYFGQYRDQDHIKRIKSLIDYFAGIGKKEQKESFLRGTWSQIKSLINRLSYEPYIDDQFEIEEIWNIVEALIKRGGFEKEVWEVKAEVLREIYENDFFDYYGVYDPMHDLAGAICSNREENLKRAKLMMDAEGGYLGGDAAKLYRELGEEEKCVEYFENHLGKDEEPYEIVMDYYMDRNRDRAVEIAEQAIVKCKKDQTPFMIFLMKAAKEKGDEKRFQKLWQSAHKRRAVNSAKVDEIFSQIEQEGM